MRGSGSVTEGEETRERGRKTEERRTETPENLRIRYDSKKVYCAV